MGCAEQGDLRPKGGCTTPHRAGLAACFRDDCTRPGHEAAGQDTQLNNSWPFSAW